MKPITEKMLLDLPEIYSEVWTNVTYTIENDGIGAYEFWGSRGFDRGYDYANIKDIKPIFSGETPEEQDEILKLIDDNFDKYAEELSDKIMIDNE